MAFQHPLHDIDFEALYRQHMAATGRRKTAADWDARAAHATLPRADDAYVAAVVAHLKLGSCTSLLDVGCGPGHIALAVAPQVPTVIGMDHSPGMLARLSEFAQARGHTHVQPLLRSWDEPWDDVPVCDVVVASRSTLVHDMGDALRKLNAHARQAVHVTSLVGGRFRDVSAQLAAGQPVPPPLPDHIYIVNILYAMGIVAEVRLLPAAPGDARWALVSWTPGGA